MCSIGKIRIDFMDTISQDEENRLQAVAHELEQVAEELRNRAMSGRAAGTLADFPSRLRKLVLELEAVAKR